MALAAACAATLVHAPAAVAAEGSPSDPGAKQWVKEVSVSRITKQQAALQRIADANGGTRDVLTDGYQDSVAYVAKQLTKSGYRVKLDRFDFPLWQQKAPSVLRQVTPVAKSYRVGTADDTDSPDVDFITMAYSPTVSLKGVEVVPVGGIVIPSPGGAASGCAASDYPAAVQGKVALVQRGTCAFVDKWALAEKAGAVGVIVFNEGNTPERQAPLYVDDTIDAKIPAVISSFAVGKELYDAYQAGQQPTVDLETSGYLQDRWFPQVIADTRRGDPDHVVVVGAHLDSVAAGPGINDDGSGTATLLTMAKRLAKPGHTVRQKVRFAWWGGEEEGLVGSTYYASHLSDADAAKIDVMLDFDMLASPNYARFVYDGDGSEAGNPSGPEGSGKVEEVFIDFFASKGLLSEPTAFDGRSDYVGFTDRGIPAGGVFAGAEGVKTVDQARIYGGAAGSWYDPCYHQACDNLDTVLSGVPPLEAEGLTADVDEPTDADKLAAANKMRGGSLKSLKQLAGAAAYAVWYFSATADPFGTTGG